MSTFPGMAHFGTYKIVAADCPWQHDNFGQAKHGAAKSAYSEMPIEDICAMPVGELAHPNGALLFLWCTGPQAADGLHIEVARAWGFRLTTRAFAWVKVNRACEACDHEWDDHAIGAPRACVVADDRIDGAVCGCGAFVPSAYAGPGNYTMGNVEDVWVGVRGDTPWPSLRARRDVRQVVMAPRGRHSEKPEEIQDRIEALWPDATPRLELFSRRRRPGGRWAHWGNEVDPCDLVFGDVIGSTWPVSPRAIAPAALDAQGALFAEAP
jgi:N6-adenosine-specific RNA methylase IME4